MGQTLLNYAIQLSDEGKSLNPAQIVREVCQQGAVPSQNCDPKDEVVFQNFLRSNLKTLGTRFPPFTQGDAALCKDLNQQIDKLNSLLAKVKPEKSSKTSSLVWDQQSAQELQTYQVAFAQMTSEFPGTYLFTSKLIAQVGNVKTPQDIEASNETGSIAQHPKVSCTSVSDPTAPGGRRTTITDARDEVKSQLIEKVKELNMESAAFLNPKPLSGINNTPAEIQQRELDARSTMIRQNPIALGHLLAEHPEYLTFDDSVCHSLSQMGADDVNSKLVLNGLELATVAGVTVIAAPGSIAAAKGAIDAGVSLNSLMTLANSAVGDAGIATQVISSASGIASAQNDASIGGIAGLDFSAWSDGDLLAHQTVAGESTNGISSTQRKLNAIQQAKTIQDQNLAKLARQRAVLDQRDRELRKEIESSSH
jgi:hypothetical protein